MSNNVVDLTSADSDDEGQLEHVVTESGDTLSSDMSTDSDSDSTISYTISSDSESESHGIKRKHSETCATSSNSNMNPHKELSYRLTSVSGILKQFNLPEMAVSLTTLLAGQTSHGHLVSSVQFNYLYDVSWLMEHYPQDGQTAPVLLVHGFRGSDEENLKLCSEPYPQISLVRAKLESAYGTHHSKMMLLEYERGLKVVILTANMISEDWHQKSQFVWCSPLICRRTQRGSQNSDFLKALVNYLNAYGLPVLKDWAHKLNEFDFASAICDDEVAFIGSVPGRHIGPANLKSFGHLRLRHLLAKRMPSKVTPQTKSEFSPNVRIICQFSSIGSLGDSADKWLLPELVTSCLACFPSGHEGSVMRATVKPRPILIYPSVADVRESLEGYMAGGSLPYRKDTASKQPWLRSYFHCWRANNTGRTRAMPHVKTYCALSSDFSRIYWLLITSANLSKAAWGKLEKNESQLCILSYEAGVLLTPSNADSDEEQLPYWKSSEILLPYELPPQPYGGDDEPWIVDERHPQRDSKNCTWLC